jgi:glucosylceramidase
MLDRLRNWASSYNAWVVMLDDQGKPNNGPFPATHAIVKLDSKTLQPERLLEYYVYGQFMRFVQRGAVRIESTSPRADLKHVAFRNPDGKLVLIVVHGGTQESTVKVGAGAQTFAPHVLGKSINTFVWTP